MSKVIASAAEKQTSSSLFELEPVGNKKVQLDFSAPKLSAFGGLAAIREHTEATQRSTGRYTRPKSRKWMP